MFGGTTEIALQETKKEKDHLGQAFPLAQKVPLKDTTKDCCWQEWKNEDREKKKR